MSTSVRQRLNPYPATNCLHCGEPIDQPEHGGRPRQYCDKPSCRKAGSRAAKKLTAERADQAQRDNLRLLWQQLDNPGTSAILEEILATYGIAAATLATEALKCESEAACKPAEGQNLFIIAAKSILTTAAKIYEEHNYTEMSPGQLLNELLKLPLDELLNIPVLPRITQMFRESLDVLTDKMAKIVQLNQAHVSLRRTIGKTGEPARGSQKRRIAPGQSLTTSLTRSSRYFSSVL